MSLRVNITNKHFIHTGVAKDPEIISIYLCMAFFVKDKNNGNVESL